MTVAVIVPWRGGCEHRERALSFILDMYARHHPNWTVIVSESNRDPWCKARAVSPAIEASRVDVVVIADADVWCPSTATAVEHVEQGAPWAVPHSKVHRLTEQSTTAFIAGARNLELAEPAYTGTAGGGIVALRRGTYLDHTPLDDRFEGWGHEDQSWALALTCLHGPPWRGTAPLWHLWHPPQARLNRRTGSAESRALHRRYVAARRHPARMRALVEEVTAWPTSASS